MADDDFWQQVQEEEMQQWLVEHKEKFNEIFNEGLSITPNDGTIKENEDGINSKR